MNLLFNELPILEETKQAIEALGLVETTSIQHHAIPKMLEGRDLIGQAQTGTGKTFAFAIPILEKLDLTNSHIQALVICPTRELTLQVYKEFIKLVKFNKDVKVTSIYGGESYNKQFKALSLNPQIVVATPGRAIDHLERGTIDFSHIKILVMDEADEMLKMGFQEDLERLLKDTPQERQTALFSATIPPFIKKVAEKYQKQPEMIRIETPTLTVSKVEQIYYHVKKSDRDHLLIRVLDYYQPGSAIIFANTKVDVDQLSDYLQKHQYEADALHGDLKQSQRDYVMGRFRSKRLKYLIATDVAARGLDISHVDMVINYEIPFEDEIYVHRIGRTGRAGKSGMSVSLVYPSMRGKLQMIERFIKIKMTEKTIPTEEEILEKMVKRNYQAIKDMVQSSTSDHQHIIDSLMEEGFSKDQIISALIEKNIDQPKVYDPIEAPQQRRRDESSFDRSSRNSRQTSSDAKPRRESSSRGSMNYKMVSINLGKEDGIRPVQLLDLFKKHADMYPKNVGDIIMNKHDTEFQIHPAAIKRLEELNGKVINGKKIRISLGKNK
jgi:ATP-dependent RNA helicase DeaD